MGKRSSSELVEETKRNSEKKSKKEKKEKKNEDKEVISEEPTAVDETIVEDTAVPVDVKRISIDDYESVKPLFKKWLKEVKEM